MRAVSKINCSFSSLWVSTTLSPQRMGRRRDCPMCSYNASRVLCVLRCRSIPQNSFWPRMGEEKTGRLSRKEDEIKIENETRESNTCIGTASKFGWDVSNSGMWLYERDRAWIRQAHIVECCKGRGRWARWGTGERKKKKEKKRRKKTWYDVVCVCGEVLGHLSKHCTIPALVCMYQTNARCRRCHLSSSKASSIT